VADDVLEAELRSVLTSGDDYATCAKPQIDWDDSDARAALIDTRAKDAFACLAVLDGRELSVEVGEAAELVASVGGPGLGGDRRRHLPDRQAGCQRSDHLDCRCATRRSDISPMEWGGIGGDIPGSNG
jgi:hypothetical protein